MVLRRCRYLLRDEADALDAMQDTFVQVLRHRERLDARGPSSLLYCIATNVCLNRLRTLRRGPMSGDDRILAGIASTEDVESRAVAAGFLDRVFASERASTRTMAVLHYVDGMTLEEVARHVRLSVSGVRKRLAGLSERARALEEA
jgi:RNA polymerase sigma-70 factor (ECF subfamily)